MQWITVRRLQREYALPKMLARAVAAEQWRSIVCRCCEPWIWLRRWSVSAQACCHCCDRRSSWLGPSRGYCPLCGP